MNKADEQNGNYFQLKQNMWNNFVFYFCQDHDELAGGSEPNQINLGPGSGMFYT